LHIPDDALNLPPHRTYGGGQTRFSKVRTDSGTMTLYHHIKRGVPLARAFDALRPLESIGATTAAPTLRGVNQYWSR
jgi:hypothetical protein